MSVVENDLEIFDVLVEALQMELKSWPADAPGAETHHEAMLLGKSLSYLRGYFIQRGFVTHVAATDAEIVYTSDELICSYGRGGHRDEGFFPIGFRRDGQSYRVFAICAHCLVVVGEL